MRKAGKELEQGGDDEDGRGDEEGNDSRMGGNFVGEMVGG